MIPRLLLIAVLLAGNNLHAATTTIGTANPGLFESGFGSGEVYRGETFRLPSGSAALANSLTVFVGPTADLGANFHVLITEVDTRAGFHPNNVLFESGTLNVPLLGDSTEFVINLGGLSLQPGRDYAWILDHYVVGNEANFVDMDTGLGNYPDGEPFSYPTGMFPSGTRQDHFASNNWFVGAGLGDPDKDFAFKLNVTLVPEPEAYVLMLAGLLLLTIRLRSLAFSNK